MKMRTHLDSYGDLRRGFVIIAYHSDTALGLQYVFRKIYKIDIGKDSRRCSSSGGEEAVQ